MDYWKWEATDFKGKTNSFVATFSPSRTCLKKDLNFDSSFVFFFSLTKSMLKIKNFLAKGNYLKFTDQVESELSLNGIKLKDNIGAALCKSYRYFYIFLWNKIVLEKC